MQTGDADIADPSYAGPEPAHYQGCLSGDWFVTGSCGDHHDLTDGYRELAQGGAPRGLIDRGVRECRSDGGHGIVAQPGRDRGALGGALAQRAEQRDDLVGVLPAPYTTSGSPVRNPRLLSSRAKPRSV
jgi:hypothetical protein